MAAVVVVVAATAAWSIRTGGVDEMSPATPSTLGEAPPPAPARPILGEAPGDKRAWGRVGISGDGQVTAYQQSVYVKPGDADGPLYVWDGRAGELTFVADNVESGTRPALSIDGRVVVFAEERDSMTKRDGVNPDPDVHRIVRWTAAAGLTPLTGFDYERIPAIDISDDGEVVVFAAYNKQGLQRYQTFLIQDGSPAASLSAPSEGSGSSIYERIVSVSGDGTRVAFMQWQKDRSMVYVHDVRTGDQRSLDQIVPGVTRAQEAALSGDGHRLAVVLTDDEWTERSVAVLDLGTGAVLSRSRPGLHRGAHTGRGYHPMLSYDGELLVYRAPGKSDGMSLDAGELFKSDVLIAMEVTSGRARFAEGNSHDVVLLADGRLVIGRKVYRF